MLPLGVSFFLLIGIGIVYYRARRGRFRLSEGGSGAGPGSPEAPTGGGS
jgi:hypothetical protein